MLAASTLTGQVSHDQMLLYFGMRLVFIAVVLPDLMLHVLELNPAVGYEQAASCPQPMDASHDVSAAFADQAEPGAAPSAPGLNLSEAMPASKANLAVPRPSRILSLNDIAGLMSPSLEASFGDNSISAAGRLGYSAASSPSFEAAPERPQAQAGTARSASEGLQGTSRPLQPAQEVSTEYGQLANSITSGFFQSARSRCLSSILGESSLHCILICSHLNRDLFLIDAGQV